jgi:hypothetical protein
VRTCQREEGEKEYRFGQFSLMGRRPIAGLGRKGRPGLLSPFFCSVIFSFLFSYFSYNFFI